MQKPPVFQDCGDEEQREPAREVLGARGLLATARGASVGARGDPEYDAYPVLALSWRARE